jgi:hypothetical protein
MQCFESTLDIYIPYLTTTSTLIDLVRLPPVALSQHGKRKYMHLIIRR